MNNAVVGLDQCDYQVVIDVQLAAGSAKEAARSAFWEIRDRLDCDPAVNFHVGFVREDMLRASKVCVRTRCDDVETVLLSQVTPAQASPEDARYETSIVVSVTATSSAEALEYALEDLADDALTPWQFEVAASGGTSAREVVSVIKDEDY